MIKSPLRRDSLVLIFQRCFGVFLQIILTFLLTRHVDLAAFSKWSFVQSLILIFSLLDFPLVSALQNTLIKYRCEQNEKGIRWLFLSLLQMIVLISGVMLGGVSIWVLFFPADSWMGWVLFFLTLKSLFQFGKAGLFADHKIVEHTLAEATSYLLAASYVVCALYYKVQMDTLIIGFSGFFSLGALYSTLYFLLQRNGKWEWIPLQQMKETLTLLMKPITLLFLQNCAGILLFSADVTLIYYLFDSIDVSQFYLYQRIFNGVLLITLPITTAAWVRFTTDYEQGADDQMIKTLFDICKISFLVIVLVGGTLSLMHQPIVYLLSGHEWSSSLYCISFMTNIFLVTFQSIFSTALNAMGHYEIQLKNYLILLLAKVLLIALLLNKIEAIHILWITNGVLLPMIGVNFWKWHRILRERRSLRIQ